MFGKNLSAVLDIDSQKISLAAFTASATPSICGVLSRKYSGFQEGAFLVPEELFPMIKKLIEDFSIINNIRIKHLTINIPGDFCCAVSKNVELDINKKVTPEDIESIFLIGDTYKNHNQFTNIDSLAVYYKTNCNPERLLSPIGQSCERIVGRLSYILCERYFINIFNELAKRLKIKINYSAATLSEVRYINKQKLLKAFSGNLLLHLGYLSSTLAYSIGSAPVHMRSFSLGGGTVAGDITLVLNIPFSHACALYKKLNLNLNPKSGETYTVFVDGESFCYDIKTVNAIAEERIFDIANYIKSAIDDSAYEVDKSVPLYISGSALCFVPGVKEIIEGVTKRIVELSLPDYPGWEDADYFSMIAAITATKPKNLLSIFKK